LGIWPCILWGCEYYYVFLHLHPWYKSQSQNFWVLLSPLVHFILLVIFKLAFLPIGLFILYLFIADRMPFLLWHTFFLTSLLTLSPINVCGMYICIICLQSINVCNVIIEFKKYRKSNKIRCMITSFLFSFRSHKEMHYCRAERMRR